MEHFVKDGPLQNGLLSFSALRPSHFILFPKGCDAPKQNPETFLVYTVEIGHLKYIYLTSVQRDIEKKLLVFYSISEKVFSFAVAAAKDYYIEGSRFALKL